MMNGDPEFDELRRAHERLERRFDRLVERMELEKERRFDRYEWLLIWLPCGGIVLMSLLIMLG